MQAKLAAASSAPTAVDTTETNKLREVGAHSVGDELSSVHDRVHRHTVQELAAVKTERDGLQEKVDAADKVACRNSFVFEIDCMHQRTCLASSAHRLYAFYTRVLLPADLEAARKVRCGSISCSTARV